MMRAEVKGAGRVRVKVRVKVRVEVRVKVRVRVRAWSCGVVEVTHLGCMATGEGGGLRIEGSGSCMRARS